MTTYIAEFWNTVTNLWMILPPIHGLYYVYKNKFEKRYVPFAHITATEVKTPNSLIAFGFWGPSQRQQTLISKL